MSTLSAIIYLLYIFCETKSNHDQPHSMFYNIQWIATHPESEAVEADTFTVTQVSLIGPKELKTIPIITGLKDLLTILDNNTDNTFAIKHTINITWDFNGILTEVDYVRIVTNCGASKQSLFCNNSNLYLTNASTKYIKEAKLTENVVKKNIDSFINEDNCQNNILIVDRKIDKSEIDCGFKCQQCLTYLHIDLNANIINTSYTNKYYAVYTGNVYNDQYTLNNSECNCPFYNLNLIENNKLQVLDTKNKTNVIGIFVPGSTLQRAQITWNQFMGENKICRQQYLPNTGSFMSIPSWRNVSFKYLMRRTVIVNHDTENQSTFIQLDIFEINIEKFLNELFNKTWVNTVIFKPTDISQWIWELNIMSYDQQMTLEVVELIQMFNQSDKNITAQIKQLTADSFEIDIESIQIIRQDIKPFVYTWYPYLGYNDYCDKYFQITTLDSIIENKTDKIMILVIILIIGCILLVIVIIISKRRNKMICFKQKPETCDEIKGYPKTHSDEVRNIQTPPFKIQTTFSVKKGLNISKSNIYEFDESNEKGVDSVYYSGYSKVNQTSFDIDNDIEIKRENKIELRLKNSFDSVKKRVYEFTDFSNELRLDIMIGKGSFAKVWKAKWEAENVAVKMFNSVNENNSNGNSNEVVTEKEFKEIYSEIYLATSIAPHPNIIRIIGFCRQPLCVIMEYMAGGSVQKLVYGQSNKPMPSVSEKIIIIVKACFGLAKLTEYKFHHRDIAARNILLGKYEGKIDSDTAVKITDFGMIRLDGGIDNDNKTKNTTGPCKWMAPESIKHKIYNEKTDIYMFGITIWEIMYGREPYQDIDALNAAMNVCVKNERPEFLWDLPLGMKTLIKKCWDKNPNNRPRFKEIAYKLEELQNRVESNIEEIHEMDKVVEKSSYYIY